jgi:hypothetical protein
MIVTPHEFAEMQIAEAAARFKVLIRRRRAENRYLFFSRREARLTLWVSPLPGSAGLLGSGKGSGDAAQELLIPFAPALPPRVERSLAPPPAGLQEPSLLVPPISPANNVGETLHRFLATEVRWGPSRGGI